MKTIIAIALILLPSFALANSVQVYPTITNAHGATKTSMDISVCMEINELRQCDKGVPTFSAPLGSSYKVIISPPSGYSYKTKGYCSGTVTDDNAKMICYVDYSDGAPVLSPPSVGTEFYTKDPSPISEQITYKNKSNLTDTQINAIIGLLRAFGVDEATVSTIYGYLK